MEQTCQNAKQISIDVVTPRNVPLSAFYKRSFGFHTVKERYPVILTQVIDNLVRNKQEIFADYGEDAEEALKEAIGEISKLKYEIQTNKNISKFTIDCTSPGDLKVYNKVIDEETERLGGVVPNWYNSRWLFNECYMHRKLRHFFEKHDCLHNFDHYRYKKEETLVKSFSQLAVTGTFLYQLVNGDKGQYNIEEKFMELIKMNLWGNKCDLSFSNGVINFVGSEQDISLASLDPYIVVDDSDKIWKAVSSCSDKTTIDIIFDNVGYELFTDLCLADYLLTHNMAKKIRLYPKQFGWYISDVTNSDFHWTLRQLGNSENKHLESLSKRWSEYLDKGLFTIELHDFWTLPYGFSKMKEVDKKLYDKLSEAKFVFFKGDLNYRKLFDDINWEPTTSAYDGLQGFHPTKLCSLRTVKSDVLCALREGVMEKIEAKTPNWAWTGEYAVICYSDNQQ